MTGTVEDPALVEWCRAELGAAPARQLFAHRSTSDVTGLRLTDGREVVVKIRRDPVARVDACLRLQSALFASHYPCPRPLTEASVLGGMTAHAEECVDIGEPLMGDDTALAIPLAAGFADLAEQLDRLRELVDPQVLVPPLWVSWWSQRPWSRQAQVPELVYDAADRVRARLADVYLPGVLGHADWESQNLRWAHGRLVVVHDWDSLTWAPEAVLVGAAAAVFPAQSQQPETASIAASATFLEHYQTVRGREFSADELEVAWAAGLLPSLLNARNEVLEVRRPLVLNRLREDCADRLRLAGA
jgi:hypothetical protein